MSCMAEVPNKFNEVVMDISLQKPRQNYFFMLLNTEQVSAFSLTGKIFRIHKSFEYFRAKVTKAGLGKFF